MKNAYEHWNKKEWRYLGNTPVDVRLSQNRIAKVKILQIET